ncbi:diguanylate cyclase [Shewanella sp. D64]|nr:diguanylate cyclase [Shewanella sp. D64]MEC4725994.1 diguanylate cyclase [Shewanella sp. D64]MEC4737249.1 diguanylate cyclase [Shewanella sp. E94]WBJ98211.1 diguanylate cyclase [Shewanella sp. MTB7]
MSNVEHMSCVLASLPDPAFLLSRSGRYLAVFGGRDPRYYHDGSKLVGLYISDLIKPEKADWFDEKIVEALQSRKLLIVEYELSNKDVKGLLDEGPDKPIWFEGRIYALDFLIDDEEIVLWVASNISVRHEQEIKLRELSDKDQLTNLFNRRRLEQDLILQYEAFARYSEPTSILLFDLDNLKLLNDTYGHHVGDEAIIAVANVCRSELRKIDTAYRLGGDEFVIVLPSIELAEAVHLANRLRELFNLELNKWSFEGACTTVSIGVTTISLRDSSYGTALKRADDALYKAKRNGKNRVIST